ncbi:polysaccharide deacetylase family protein [uncultured Desulfuromusa sp.]|uniref:polysaccharide deacetylase family protein n=1 Tax=uncultured Desulfuromusa sp. TaxID=219183 RepID=UPI002AA783D4|nr:polysaccharide deacetylase family protein [uncultured Desulfuromusa sp.]
MKMFNSEICSWLEMVLKERFGHAFSITEEAGTLRLTVKDSKVSIRFDKLQPIFHQSRSDFSCSYWQASNEGYVAPVDDVIPAPSEEELCHPLIEPVEGGSVVHYDILGLTYWMLSRLEEVGRSDLDEYDRFPASSSHAFNHGYLERPIVDEWLAILGQIIRRQWPELQLKNNEFSFKVSHDVDFPSRYGLCSSKRLLRTIAGDVLHRQSLKSLLSGPWIHLKTRRELHPADPNNTFDWIMDLSERQGLVSSFYFMCGCTDSRMDGGYEPGHPAVRKLMRRIHERGHEVGLHPSFCSYTKPGIIQSEAETLRTICQQERIAQSQWGSRMHYLRWQHPNTMYGLVQAGMSYDASLGYADRVGFRCGTCYEYPAFDPVEKKQLNLRLRPLVAMETTIISSCYMGLGVGEKAIQKIEYLQEVCQKVRGAFTLLWHNSSFNDELEKKLYSGLIQTDSV